MSAEYFLQRRKRNLLKWCDYLMRRRLRSALVSQYDLSLNDMSYNLAVGMSEKRYDRRN